ncbi:MAG: hypothetical protein ABJL44_04225 [Algibacter sp.]
MKHIILLFSFVLLTTCGKNNLENENCKFLLDIPVNISINLNLPEYSQLKFSANSIYIPNLGNKGVIVTNIGGNYLAWDAADPNHAQSSCSTLVNSGLTATCGCDDGNEYSLATGQALNDGTLQCALRFYQVDISGSSLRISY